MRPWSAVLFALALSAPPCIHAGDESIEPCRALTDDAARLACFDALNRPAKGPEPATDPGADHFGKRPVESRESSELQQLASRVVGKLVRWESGTVITLENGQKWKVVEDRRGYYPDTPDNPQVIITRSYFGAYWLAVKPKGNKIKVRRIK